MTLIIDKKTVPPQQTATHHLSHQVTRRAQCCSYITGSMPRAAWQWVEGRDSGTVGWTPLSSPERSEENAPPEDESSMGQDAS